MKSAIQRASEAWLENHKLGDGWYISHAHFRMTDKKPYVLLHRKDGGDFSWCINCCGNGHYFSSKKEARHWLWDNGWATRLHEKETDGVKDDSTRVEGA